MMAVIFALAEAATTPASIAVIDAGPAHTGCPDLSMTQKEVERIHVADTEGGKWVARYVVTQSSVPGEAELVRLELSDPEGRVRLRRELSLTGETCEAVARAIALVIERYFADLAQEPSPEEPVKAEPPPPVRPRPAPAIVETEPPPLGVLRFGAGALFVFPDPGLAGDLQLRFDSSFWSAGIRGALPSLHREDDLPGGSTAELEKIPLRAWFGVDWEQGPFELSLGPEVLASLERGGVAGDDGGHANRLVLGAGAQANVLFQLAHSVALTFAVGGDFVLPLAMSQILVKQVESDGHEHDAEVLRPRTIEGFASAGVAFSIF